MRKSGYCLLTVFAALAIARARAQSPMTLERWVREGIGRFPQTQAALELTLAIEAVDLSLNGGVRESPFTLQTDLSYTKSQENPELGFGLRRVGALTLSNQLIYSTRSSFRGTLSSNYSLTSNQAPTIYPLNGRPLDLELKFSYDIVQGGPRGALETRQRIETLGDLQTRYARQGDLLAARVDLQRLLVDLYVSQCKIAQLKSAQDQVSATIQTGRAQARSRTISHKDFLNFIDLENSFSRRMAAEESARTALLQRLQSWQLELGEQLTGAEKAGLECRPPSGQLNERVERLAAAGPQLEKVAEGLPAMSAAGALREASVETLRLTKLARQVSLSPYVQGALSQSEISSQKLGSAAIGLNLTWNIPGAKGDYNAAAAERSLASTTHEARRIFQDAVSRLRLLHTGLVSQRNIMTVLQRSLENSNELLKTLRGQRSIGMVDSLNYTTAFVSQVDTGNAILDSWGALEKSIFELDEYLKFMKPQRTPQGR